MNTALQTKRKIVLSEKEGQFFNKYKVYLLPVVICIITFFLIGQVTIPQIFSILDTEKQITTKKDDIAKIKQTIKQAQSVSDQKLKDNLSLVNAALPNNQDIVAVYNGLSTAASNAQVTVDDYTISSIKAYQKGNTAAPSPQKTPGIPGQAGTISLSVSATGTAKNSLAFIQELTKVFPLTSVPSLSLRSGKDIGLKIDFYYEPYNTSALAATDEVGILSPFQKQILKQLQSLKKP